MNRWHSNRNGFLPTHSLRKTVRSRKSRRARRRQRANRLCENCTPLQTELLEDRRLLTTELLGPDLIESSPIFIANATPQYVSLQPSEMYFIAAGPHPHDLRLSSPNNTNAADSTNANTIASGGSSGLDLDGSGYTVGVWESGGVILDTHQELTGRVTNFNVAAATDHATHVAGTIAAAGVEDRAKGMASAVSLIGFDDVDDINEFDAAASAVSSKSRTIPTVSELDGLWILRSTGAL